MVLAFSLDRSWSQEKESKMDRQKNATPTDFDLLNQLKILSL